MRSRRVVALAAIGTMLAVGTVVGLAAPAQAHNYLASSTPAEGETLTVLPDRFVITTNDELMNLGGGAGGFALRVTDVDGAYYGDGCVTVDGPAMSAVAALGEPGDYTMTWQLVSIDGHPVSGEVAFFWQPEDATEISPGASTAPSCGMENADDQSATEPPAQNDTHQNEDTQGDATQNQATQDGVADAASDLLWVGGAALAVIAAAIITVLVLRRKKPEARP